MNSELGKYWIRVNQDELIVSDWEEIREDLVNVFGEVYNYPFENGKYQIPVNSSDYIMISNLALAFWNMSRNIKKIYDQHSLSQASDNFLDKVMSYYGVYRSRAKKYIIQIKLYGQGSEMRFDNLSEWVDLYSDKFPNIKFIYLNEVERGNTWTKYNVIASDLFSTSIEDLRKLSLTSITGEVSNNINVNDETTWNKIIVLQREQESDQEFRLRAKLNNEYKRLYQELEKNKYINKLTILDASSVIPFIKEAPLVEKVGELAIFVELEEWVLDDKNNLNTRKSDVLGMISEYIPLGITTTHINNEKIYGVEKEEVDTPVTDIINSKIKIHFVKPVKGALVFRIVEQLDKDLLNDRIQTLIGWLNNMDIFENYKRETLLYHLNKLFKVDWLSLKYFIAKTDKNIEVENEWTENQVQNITFYSPQLKYEGNSPQTTLKEIQEEGNEIYRSLKFTKYKYKQNQDNSISVVIY